MIPSEIEVGKKYRMFGSMANREVRPRTVKSYDPDGSLAGGTVRTRTDSGCLETMAGDYFAAHVIDAAAPARKPDL